MGECPLCGESTNKPSTRLIKESCGHAKCRLCLLNEESGCSVCEGIGGDIPRTIESIGNFDYCLPVTTIPNCEEHHSTPRKLDFNKIPDDFIDCPLDIEKLTIDDSVNRNSENVVANVPGPEMVDIGTETESIIEENNVQVQTTPKNTHSSISQETQIPTQSAQNLAKPPESTEVLINAFGNNHPPHQAPVVQNANFIPVTQRADGRQFITIAFIANNSPNKNQQIITPILNQCLPAITNMTGVQRPGGSQCIPMIGNVNALQNGNQFIIRGPNILPNLVGNPSVPIIGNLNAMQNLGGKFDQPMSIVENPNAVKNLVENQSLASVSNINTMQAPTKGQSVPSTGSPNVTHKVVRNHSYQLIKPVPKSVESQPAPIQENNNTTLRQMKTRGLPRIKTVKNVNIAKKSATNQSDKVNSQIDKNPLQGAKGKRKRKELPVYLIPRKPSEQAKNIPPKSPAPVAPVAPVIGCMSPEYKLEDYLLFNKQQQASNVATKNFKMQTGTINYTQMINKPSESVINETLITSDQFICTSMQAKLIENNIDDSMQGQVPNEKIDDEKSTKETNECKEHQDLNVIFNIRDENKRILDDKIEDEKEKVTVSNGETSNKEEYQNLDALFDIIEKESNKLNGGMFDKEEKPGLVELSGFKCEENQVLHATVNDGKDANHVLNQKVDIQGGKDQNLNNGIHDANSEGQVLNKDMGDQNKESDDLNKDICFNNEISRNLPKIDNKQEQNLIGELAIQNRKIEHLDEEADSSEVKNHKLNTEMEYEQEESETLNEINNDHRGEILGKIADEPFINGKIDNEEQSQSSDEKIVDMRKESNNENGELSSQKDENHHFDEEVISNEENIYNQNVVNYDEDNSHCINEKIDDKENSAQTIYEDISDEENESGGFNNENQELATSSGGNNDDKTVQEAQILEKKGDDQNEESNQNLEIQLCKEENGGLPLDVNNDSLVFETNNPDNNEIDVTHKNEQSVVKKPRGRPKKSLCDEEQARKLDILDKSEQSTDSEKDSKLLNKTMGGGGRDESLTMKTRSNEDGRWPEDVDAILTFTEPEKSKDQNTDAVTESEQPLVVKKRRGRKKKSLSICESESKPEVSDKNQELIVKRPRGRPKKSLSNIEQPNKSTCLQEAEQPAPMEEPSLREENNHDESQANLDETPNDEESHILDVSVEVHNQDEDSMELKLDMPDNDEECTDSDDKSNFVCMETNDNGSPDPALENKEAIVIKKQLLSRGRRKSRNEQPIVKKPRGRPKKSLSITEQSNVLQETGLSIAAELANEKVNDEESITKLENFNENESPITITKPRGRPKKSQSISEQERQPRGRSKKSLSNVEYQNNLDFSHQTKLSNTMAISNSFGNYNDEQSTDQQERNEGENKVPRSDVLNHDETSQNSNANTNDGDKESLYSDIITNSTLSNKNDLDVQTPTNKNTNVQSTVIKKSRGRPKKSLIIYEQESEAGVSDIKVQSIVVKKPRGRPKKSLSSVKHQSELDISYQTELSNAMEISNSLGNVNDEKAIDQHEKNKADNEVPGREAFSQDETYQNSHVITGDGVKESLHSEKDSDITKLENLSENEPSITIEKSRGKSKKSLSVCKQERKPRGRSKKSLSNVKYQSEFDISRRIELSSTIEISNSLGNANDKELTDQQERNKTKNEVQSKEAFTHDETSQHSLADTDDGDKESMHSDAITNSNFNDKVDLDIQTSINENTHEHSAVIKKSRGRPKKSLIGSEQQSGFVVSDVNIQPIVVKSRGRLRKSFSIFEQNQIASSQELPYKREISNMYEKINSNEIKDQREDDSERSRILSQGGFNQDEINQDSCVETNGREKNSTVIVKKPRGRPKKSTTFEQEQPHEHDLSRGKEQPIVPMDSGLGEENNDENDQAQCLNEVIDEEGKRALDATINSNDEKVQRVAASLHTENQESSILETELSVSSNRNPVDDTLDTACQSEEITVAKKARGRPKKVWKDEIVIKKRGRPKKANYEQQNKSYHGQEKERHASTKLPNLYTDYNGEDAAQPLDGKIIEEESRILNNEDRNKEETIESYNEESKCPRDEDENENIDNQEQEDDFRLYVSEEIKVTSTLSEESNEGQTKQENCNDASNDDGENHTLQKESDREENAEESNEGQTKQKNCNDAFNDDGENHALQKETDREEGTKESNERQTKQQNCNDGSNDDGENHALQKETDREEGAEGDSRNLKSQEDENKENKKDYSEKDDGIVDNVTSVTDEQQRLDKSSKVDGEVTKNATTGRKYNSFDKTNTQVIVETGKRKRKPKVLLYENEDLDISPVKKKKKISDGLSCKKESKHFPEKNQVNSLTHIKENSSDIKRSTKNTGIITTDSNNLLQENEMEISVHKAELGQNVSLLNVDENLTNSEEDESVVPTRSHSLSKDDNINGMKRNRRPKSLLYGNEDFTTTQQSTKIKKVSFLMPTNQDSLDSMEHVKEDNKLQVFTNECEGATIAKRSERIRKPKTLLYENESLTFMPIKEKYVQSEIKKEDLMFMKKFDIKLEPIVVLDRNIDSSFVKKYVLDDNSLQVAHAYRETAISKKPKSKSKLILIGKKPRGRPRLQQPNGSTAPKKKNKNAKALTLKCPELKKKRRGRQPSDNYKHIITLPGEPPTYKCSICEKIFKAWSVRTFHLACLAKTCKIFNCQFCPKKFYKDTHLIYHERMHKGDKPFSCELCGKKFVQKNKLNRHLLIHKYSHDLECNECGRKFASKEYLKSHLLSHVQSSFVFRCNQCPKAFSLDSNRKRHELSHSPIALFKCLSCPKSFKTKFDVARHVKIHQKARPFACNDCGKVFLTKFEVKRHSVIHSGEKKYTCNYCKTQFGRLDNYSRHMQHHHSEDALSEELSAENANSSTLEVNVATPSDEEQNQEMMNDVSAEKPKKISRSNSNPVPLSISFIQPLTPQSAPSPYSISQNHDLASVIRETLPDMNNAVPVISTPTSVQSSASLMDPIPLEQAFVLNRQIEEKMYTQSSFCEFPGLTRRTTVTVNRRPSFTYASRNSSESNSNSNEDTSFLPIDQEQIVEEQDYQETSSQKKDIHVHWRRRTAETLKSKIDQNK